MPFFCSYMKNILHWVFIRGSHSSEGTVKYGVPQGSVFVPVLFCIYINDLPLHIPSNTAECRTIADDNISYNRKKRHANSKAASTFVFQCVTCSLSLWIKVNDNYYTKKALRLVKTVIGWSEYWKCYWTSLTRFYCRQQILMASPDRIHNYAKARKNKNNNKTATISSFSTATYHQHRYQKNLLQRSHKTSHRLCVSSVDWL